MSRIPDSDDIVDTWWAWLAAAMVAAFTFGYACAIDGRAVMVLSLVLAIFCLLETRRLHRRDIDDVKARARAAARFRRGLP